MARKILKGALWAVLVLLVLSVAFFFYASHVLERYVATPAAPEADTVTFVVQSGQGGAKIAGMLAEGGIIDRPVLFRIYCRLKGFDKKIQVGEYRLSAAMAPGEILGKLTSGEVLLHRLTVPEGYTMLQIADLVAESGISGREAFVAALTDRRLLDENHIEADSFEGYLFPETYFFPKGIPPEKIISTMVARFREVFTQERLQRALALGFSVHQVVILASMIEKETGAAQERALISSVFHNRLKRGMRLESDPTVIYGIADFDGNLTRKHLAETTPYNTYRIKGLPAGPIANPGEEAIVAALYPADTEYLFFVAKKDGTHQFSSNIQDHNRAVAKYQLKR